MSSIPQLIFDNQLDKLPPHNLEAEMQILGSCLLDSAVGPMIADRLEEHDFFLSSHQIIWRAIAAVVESGKTVNLMSVAAWLYDHELLEQAGGQATLARLHTSTITAATVLESTDLVLDKSYRRQLIQDGHQIAQLAASEWMSSEQLHELIQKRIAGKTGILNKLKPEKERSHSQYHEMIAEIERLELEIENPGLKRWELDRIAARYKKSVRVLEDCWFRHLTYEGDIKLESWEELKAQANEFSEWLLQGFLPKQGLILMHAEGGCGKTKLFYDWAYCLVSGKNWNDSFAVSAAARRILFVQTDELPSETVAALETRGFTDGTNFKFMRHWNIQNIAGINRAIEEFQPDVVLCDSLHSISQHSIFTENDSEYARPVLALRKLAEKHNILLFLIHHSNKEGDVRGSSAIKASCSMEMSLRFDPDHKDPDATQRILTIGKTRSYRRPAEYLIELDPESGQYQWLGEYKHRQTGDERLPLKERIIQFLSQERNKRFEYEELCKEIGGAIDSIRRAACELAADGIINRVKEGRRSLFFLQWQEENHREKLMIREKGTDRMIDRNGIALSVSLPEFHDRPDHENDSFLHQTPEEKNNENRDRADRKEFLAPSNLLPESDSAYDQSCDRPDDFCDRPNRADRKQNAETTKNRGEEKKYLTELNKKRDRASRADRKDDHEISQLWGWHPRKKDWIKILKSKPVFGGVSLEVVFAGDEKGVSRKLPGNHILEVRGNLTAKPTAPDPTKPTNPRGK